MLNKVAKSTLLATILLFAMTGLAQAHAVIYPRSVNANSYEKLILRVPAEKESDTVKVRVQVPEGFTVSRVKPLPGWSYTTEKSADGKSIVAITWTGGKIAPGEFQEFEFQGRTAEKPGRYAFPAQQTYADGETVAWTGPSDAKTPASVVEVKATGGGADAHGQEKGAGAAPASADRGAAQTARGGQSPLTTAAAYGGLLLGAAALVVALRRK